MRCCQSALPVRLARASRLQPGLAYGDTSITHTERYRQHRDAEEAATRAAWEAANPDRRTWWDKLRGRTPPQFIRPADSPFTCPAFEPTEEQRQNMTRLMMLIKGDETPRQGDVVVLAELFRELGRFEEAESMISTLEEEGVDITSRIIARRIKEKQPAPLRYRM